MQKKALFLSKYFGESKKSSTFAAAFDRMVLMMVEQTASIAQLVEH